MWQVIRSIHRAAHLTIAVSPATAADLVGAGACDGQAVKVGPSRHRRCSSLLGGAAGDKAAAQALPAARPPRLGRCLPPPLLEITPSVHLPHSALVQVWPKAVDCTAFSPAHACTRMRARLAGGDPAPGGSSAAADGPLLLYVGRVSPEKNIALLRPLLERVPGARLAVVGDGPALEVSCAGLGGAGCWLAA